MPDRRRRVILVHGAWHGGWAWARVAAELQHRGLDTLVIDLPGAGRTPGRCDLEGHAVALVSAVSEVADEHTDLVLCAHSYGGAVISEAAPLLPGVTELIYVAAFQLAQGQSCGDANPAPDDAEPATPLERVGDLLHYPPYAAEVDFYHDCTTSDAQDAVARLTPEHIGTVTATQKRVGWQTIPSSYVVTSHDRALPPQNQRRMAKRAHRVRELHTGHAPMLSHPALLAATIAELATGD